MLILLIKRQWFDMIRSGRKKEEYREIKPYWESRFRNVFEMHPYSSIPTGLDEQRVCFRNGYAKTSPQIIATCVLDIKEGKEQWGALPGKRYYVLTIKEIIEERN